MGYLKPFLRSPGGIFVFPQGRDRKLADGSGVAMRLTSAPVKVAVDLAGVAEDVHAPTHVEPADRWRGQRVRSRQPGNRWSDQELFADPDQTARISRQG
jgi:hypothetical protein